MEDKDARQVLDEDVYVAALDYVIRRNFFPEAPTPTEFAATVLPAGLDGLGVDQFVAKYVNEDASSFAGILEKMRVKHRQVYAWMDAQGHVAPRVLRVRELMEKRAEVKSLSRSAVEADTRQNELKHAPYTAKNALMFVPDAHHSARGSLQTALPRGEKKTITANTRFKIPQLPSDSSMVPDDCASVGTSTDSMLTAFEPSTPTIGGYKLVRTPSPLIGRDGRTLDSFSAHAPAQPSCSIHEDDSAARKFRIMESTSRELTARSLQDKATKRLRQRERLNPERFQGTPMLGRTSTDTTRSIPLSFTSATGSFASSTRSHGRNKSDMSPAARRLLASASGTDSADHALRQSYSSDTGSTPRKRKLRSTPASAYRKIGD